MWIRESGEMKCFDRFTTSWMKKMRFFFNVNCKIIGAILNNKLLLRELLMGENTEMTVRNCLKA